MKLYNYLIDTYGYDIPFMLDDIKCNDYSLPWVKKELSKLVNKKKIVRYERGIYYIPTKTIFGNSSLNPKSIIAIKYLNNSSGYYTGLAFANSLGITTQMPNTIEICTNNESSKVREVTINEMKLVLRRPRVPITNENIYVLSFLELFNCFSADYFDESRKELIVDYIKKKGIKRNQITKYAPYYPDKVMRNLIESEIIYEIA